MADKLTDKDIKKALECCASSTGAEACNRCPFNEKDICDTEDDAPQKYALDLINRQQVEIERLNKAVASSKDLIERIHQTHMEILQKEKSEAIKEFARRVQGMVTIRGRQKDYFDDLLKEMTKSVNYESSKKEE